MKKHDSPPEKQIAATIRAVADRRCRQLVLRDAVCAAAVAVTGLLLFVVIDWWVIWQNPWGRWLGLLIVSAATAPFVMRAVRRQLAGPDDAAAARAIDKSTDEKLDRWSTVAALQPNGVGATGSDAMAAALMRETAPLTRLIDPATVAPALPAPRSRILLTSACLLLLGFLAFYLPQGSPRLLARFALPWANLPLTRLHEISPPASPQLVGEELQIGARVGGKIPSKVTIEWTDSRILEDQHRPLHSLAAPADPDAPVSFELGKVRTPLRYRMLAGDAVTDWKTINITDRPKLASINVTLSDPDYSSQPPRVWQKAPNSTQAVRGSKLEVIYEMDRDLASAAVEVATAGSGDDTPKSLPLERIGDRQYRFFTELGSDLLFRPVFESSEGYANASLPFCRIAVVADQAPSVALNENSAREIVSIEQNLPVSFTAKDDVGIVAAELVVSITAADGSVREEIIPLELGDQQGSKEVRLDTQAATSDLKIASDEQLAYAVRVRDASNQSSGESSQQPDAQPKGGPQLDSDPQMTKRSLKIARAEGASADSENRQLRISGRELINQVEPRNKKLLAIEAAFGQLKALTESALQNTRAARPAKFERGKTREIPPLYAAADQAISSLGTAGETIALLATEAPGTPYAFLSIQLQAIVRSYLTPAEQQLSAAVRGRLADLPPRETHRAAAEGHLIQAVKAMTALDTSVAKARSQIETEMALAEVMEMHVARVEDLPVLLDAGGGSGTPYQRKPGEVSREQAKAALLQLESRRELYKKTAKLLEQNPDLWSRYMDKTNKEGEIFRDQLETLSQRHGKLRRLTGSVQTGDPQAASDSLLSLVTTHQHHVTSDIQRTLKKARTWAPGQKAPRWTEDLNGALLSAMQWNSEAGKTADLLTAADGIATRLRSVVDDITGTLRNASAKDRSFYQLRIGELEQTISRQKLSAQLIRSLADRSWRKAALLEQTNIAHETQQLAGTIEVKSAGLLSLGEEVVAFSDALIEIMHGTLLPPLAGSIEYLQGSDAASLEQAASSQAFATGGYREAIRALDNFVTAAIRAKDEREPAIAKASIAGLPKITANSLEELKLKLDRESEISEGFGIPCCRPTNFQVISDWETFANNSSSPAKPPPPSSQPPSPSDSGARDPKPESAEESQKPAQPDTTASKELADNQTEQKGKQRGKEKGNDSPSSDSPADKAAGESEAAKTTAGDAKKPAEEKPGPSSGPRSEMDVASLGKNTEPSSDAKTAEGAATDLAKMARSQTLEEAGDIAGQLSARSKGKIGNDPNDDQKQSSPELADGGKATNNEDHLELAGAAGDGSFRDAAMTGNAWNRLRSDLQREFLQQSDSEIPEDYRTAVEDYFRQLSRWQNNSAQSPAAQP